MDSIVLVLLLAVVGFVIWLVTTQIPMPPLWATSIQVLALVVIVLYVLTRLVHVPNVLGR